MKNESVCVVQAGLVYAAVLAALHASSFMPDEQWHEASLRDLLGGYGVVAGVALQGDVPAGFIMLRCVADEAEVLTLCVVPDAQKKGIGKKLLMWAKDYAKKECVKKIFLEVSTNNEPAKNLYEKSGFIKSGMRKKYYPDHSDALILNFDL